MKTTHAIVVLTKQVGNNNMVSLSKAKVHVQLKVVVFGMKKENPYSLLVRILQDRKGIRMLSLISLVVLNFSV